MLRSELVVIFIALQARLTTGLKHFMNTRQYSSGFVTNKRKDLVSHK